MPVLRSQGHRTLAEAAVAQGALASAPTGHAALCEMRPSGRVRAGEHHAAVGPGAGRHLDPRRAGLLRPRPRRHIAFEDRPYREVGVWTSTPQPHRAEMWAEGLHRGQAVPKQESVGVPERIARLALGRCGPLRQQLIGISLRPQLDAHECEYGVPHLGWIDPRPKPRDRPGRHELSRPLVHGRSR